MESCGRATAGSAHNVCSELRRVSNQLMKSQEINKRWVSLFARKARTAVPSASLVSSVPSLLFTVAGMVPFIPYLTAREEPPYKRATSGQKCIRTVDLEEHDTTT